MVEKQNIINGPWYGQIDSSNMKSNTIGVDLGGNPSIPQSVFITNNSIKIGNIEPGQFVGVEVFSVEKIGNRHNILSYVVMPRGVIPSNYLSSVIYKEVESRIKALKYPGYNSDCVANKITDELEKYKNVLSMIKK